jgi:hypothetical protein
MTTIEHLTPRELRAAIREQFAKMPANVDHNGMSDLDRQAAADTVAHWSTDPVTDPESPQVDSTPTGPRPDPSQGWQGLPAQPRPLTPRARIAAQIRKHDHT